MNEPRHLERMFLDSKRLEIQVPQVRRAWALFQESGVMREPDGRTGNAKLDELGALLDEMAADTHGWYGEDLPAQGGGGA